MNNSKKSFSLSRVRKNVDGELSQIVLTESPNGNYVFIEGNVQISDDKIRRAGIMFSNEKAKQLLEMLSEYIKYKFPEREDDNG